MFINEKEKSIFHTSKNPKKRKEILGQYKEIKTLNLQYQRKRKSQYSYPKWKEDEKKEEGNQLSRKEIKSKPKNTILTN